MPPPRSLRVAHATYTLRPDRAECEAVGSNGHFLGDARRIAYRDDLPADKLREVLLHEALHATFDACGQPTLFGDVEDEERVVHALTGPLLDLLRRNPRFVEFLTA